MVRPFRHRLAKAFFAVQVMRLLTAAGGPATVSQHAEPANPQLAETAASVDDWEPEHQDAEPLVDALTAEPRYGAEISGASPGDDPYSESSADRADRLSQAIDAKEGPEGKLHDAERRLVASQALEEHLAGDPTATDDERRAAHVDTVAVQNDVVSLRSAVEMAPAQRLERATASYDAAVAAERTTGLDPNSTESEWAAARMRTVDAQCDLLNARVDWESADFNHRAILHESDLAVDWARCHGLASAPDAFRDQAVFDLVQTEPASLSDPFVSEMGRERDTALTDAAPEQAARAETQHEQAAKTQQEEAARATAQREQVKAGEQHTTTTQQEQTAMAQQEQAAKAQPGQAVKAAAQQEQAAMARAQQEQAAKAQQEQAKAQQQQAAKAQQEQAAKAQQEQAKAQQEQAAKAQQEQAAKEQQTRAKAQQEQAAKAKTQQEQATKAKAQQKQAATKAKAQQEQTARQKQQAQKGHRASQQRDSARRGAQQPRPTQPAAKPPEKRPSTPQTGRQR